MSDGPGARPARRRGALFFLVASALLAAAVLAGLLVGAVPIPLSTLSTLLAGAGAGGDAARTVETTILAELRLPRVLLAALVGAGLAAAGAAYQALFRNPLADPFVIGASSGAAVGAAALLAVGAPAGAVPATAFAGAVLAVAAVYLLGGLGARASAVSLILAGAAVSTVLDAGVSLVMIVDDESLQAIFGWLLGGLGGTGWAEVAWGAPMLAAGVVLIAALARPLDALALGDETARSLGLPLAGGRLAVVAAASLATAAAVAVAGIVGFVGLVAPHAARLLVGARHGVLVPASCLLGALLVVLADLAARTVAVPREVPVGVLTALVGGPFFLVLLRRRMGGGGAP
ncbi:MAG TPA: iron ABC transporter permease [Thermoanaerobaculia bacterium]|nr:iron ABC transporter permease [Thermoanaerobaculia bacterium]